jgi:hypothetical protein
VVLHHPIKWSTLLYGRIPMAEVHVDASTFIKSMANEHLLYLSLALRITRGLFYL